MSRIIAIDWGTTNRRAYAIENGVVRDVRRDARGILTVAHGGFAQEIAALRTEWGDAPMMLAGMVGSNRGWCDAGYVPTPASAAAIAAGVVRPLPGVAILPGVSHREDGCADVMRGEEVQLLGAVAAGLAPADALLCQPGTHCKWATMRNGLIADFVTAMTGEMFAVLKAHALIGAEMQVPVADDAEFARGVEESANGDLLAALFGVRPASLLGLRAPGAASSFVSGLLIGTDVRAHRGDADIVHILADTALGSLYARAIDLVGGGRSHRIDSDAAFVAGIVAIQEHLA